MRSTFEILFSRRPPLNYDCPPVCETAFSGSGSPVIVLDPFSVGRVSGLILSGMGHRHLSWNSYPGAICYSVYQADNSDEPFGSYHIIAECLPDNNFDLPPTGGPFVVTAVTPDGETPPSTPPIGGGDGANVVDVEATVPETKFGETDGEFTFTRTNPLTNPLFVLYQVTGDALPGIDYEALSGEAVIPAGLTTVTVPVIALDGGAFTNREVTVTVVENINDEYIIGSPPEDTVTILPPDFSCGDVPDNVCDAVWTDVDVPFGGDITCGVGSFSIHVGASSTAASKVTTVCNHGEAYDVTALATNCSTPGFIFNIPPHQVIFDFIVNGVSVGQVVHDAFDAGTWSMGPLTGTLPAHSVSTLEIRVSYLAIGAFGGSNFNGDVSVTPTTPP